MSGLVLKPRQRRDWAAPASPIASGRIAGLEIQDREDRRKAECDATAVMENRSKAQVLDAQEWAALVHFTVEQQPFAAIAAVMLRDRLGPGNVTRQIVFGRCRAQYPDLFGGGAV